MNNLTQQTQGTTTNELQQILNTQVANWSLLGVKLHHYHWYVKVLSSISREIRGTVQHSAGYVDELAERMLAIGGKPAPVWRNI